MAAYSRAVNEVVLAGPTLFGPVINNAAEIANKSLFSGSHKYFVLLIITVQCRITYDCLTFILSSLWHFFSIILVVFFRTEVI